MCLFVCLCVRAYISYFHLRIYSFIHRLRIRLLHLIFLYFSTSAHAASPRDPTNAPVTYVNILT